MNVKIGKTNKTFPLIGKGGYGQVYDSQEGFVIKVSYDNISETRLKNKSLDITQEEIDNYRENPWREIYIHYLFNELIKSRKLMHLPFCYGYKVHNQKLLLAIETYDGSFESIVNELTFAQLQSVMFQILYAFAYLQKKFNFFQDDIGFRNILYKRIPLTTPHFIYIVNDTEYHVANEGIFVALSDFGHSIVSDFELTSDEKESLNKNNLHYQLHEIIDLFFEVLKTKYVKIMEKKQNKDLPDDFQFIHKVCEYVNKNILYRKLSILYDNVDEKTIVSNKTQQPLSIDNIFQSIFSNYISSK